MSRKSPTPVRFDLEVSAHRNIRDFKPAESTRAGGAPLAGFVLVSTKAFPDDRRYVGALIEALDKLLVGGGLDSGAVVFSSARESVGKVVRTTFLGQRRPALFAR